MNALSMTARQTIAHIAEVCDVPAACIKSPSNRRERMARNRAAYALIMTGAGNASDIARELGFADRSGLRHAVLKHSRDIGQPVARMEDLMGRARPRRIDRAKLAFLFAAWCEREGLTQVQAAARIGVSRTVISKVSTAQALDDESLVAVMTAAGLELSDIRVSGDPAQAGVSCEFYGKHAGAA